MTGETCFLFDLRHLVESECELALLVSSVVLVKNVLRNSLVNLLNSCCVSNLCFVLVTSFNSGIELLDCGLELCLEHLILECLHRNNLNTLLCRLNIRHLKFSLQFLYGFIAELSPVTPERVRSETVSYSM